jgi:3-phosphoshikimate 1-carboxyvinyltransferase
VSDPNHVPSPVSSGRGAKLQGRAQVPGDKSISHRSLILGLLAIGETRVHGLLEADDVLRTAAAARALGAGVQRDENGTWRIVGAGLGGLAEPAGVLDFGNAGTGSRLMMGVAGSHPITTTFDGDDSLRSRPMRRILDPLVQMGTVVVSEADGGRVPLTLRGPRETIPITYETPAPSAQIKSAVLLAGLNSPGVTTVVERRGTTPSGCFGISARPSRWRRAEWGAESPSRVSRTSEVRTSPCRPTRRRPLSRSSPLLWCRAPRSSSRTS